MRFVTLYQAVLITCYENWIDGWMDGWGGVGWEYGRMDGRRSMDGCDRWVDRWVDG